MVQPWSSDRTQYGPADESEKTSRAPLAFVLSDLHSAGDPRGEGGRRGLCVPPPIAMYVRVSDSVVG